MLAKKPLQLSSWKQQSVFLLTHLCVGWGLADLGLAHGSLAWSHGLGPGVFYISFALLGPVSYLTRVLLMAAQYEQEWKDVMPPKVYAWSYYDTIHTQLAKISCMAESNTSAWEMDSAFIQETAESVAEIQYAYL